MKAFTCAGATRVEPKLDCLGRNRGKTVSWNGTKIYSEDITYLKHGDHATSILIGTIIVAIGFVAYVVKASFLIIDYETVAGIINYIGAGIAGIILAVFAFNAGLGLIGGLVIAFYIGSIIFAKIKS